MPSQRTRTAGRVAAARTLDALGRGADGGLQLARTIYGRWRARSAPPRPALTAPARAPVQPTAAPAVAGDSDLSEIEVGDLRAELARELERLAGAEIAASRPAAERPDVPEGRAAPFPSGDERA